jgi:microcystin-dependent protein
MTRAISMKGAVHGSTAVTTIPATPVAGVAYRNAALAAANINPGLPYSTIVDSAALNEILYRMAGLMDLVEKGGILEWSALTNYAANSFAKGADGILYKGLLASGPDEGVGVKDPNAGANPTYWENFLSASGGAGQIIVLASETVPSGYLECDGSSLLRSAYPDLFSSIGTAHGAADGTHFNLPDLRGKFLRGWNHGSGIDVDVSSRIAAKTGGATADHVGSQQADAIRNITGTWSGSIQQSWTNTFTGALYDTGVSSTNDRGDSGTSNHQVGFDASRVVPVGSDNRPININIMYCIKY